MFRVIHPFLSAAGLLGLILPAAAAPVDPAKLVNPAQMKPQGS
jgi:hypothetical protein